MSHLKVANIQHPAASSPALVLASAGGLAMNGPVDFAGATVTGLALTSFGLFHKEDLLACVLQKTGASTLAVKAGTYLEVAGVLVAFTTQKSVTMPSLTAGTDYFVYVNTTGQVQAVAASGTWPNAATAPENSRLIGGFHYAPGGNAGGRSGGNTSPAINEYSLWDQKFRPAAADPRGMALVAGMFWADIYLCNRDPQTYGTSRNAQPIADGETGSTTTPIIPTMFGGNGSTRYSTFNWWNAAETLAAFGKHLPTYSQFAALAFGTTEAASRGNDPATTGLSTSNGGSSNADQAFTSKFGIIQASGVMNVWSDDFGGGAAGASWAANTEGRGSTYQMENAAVFGGYWNESANSGSRFSAWSSSPTYSGNDLGARGVCDHLRLA